MAKVAYDKTIKVGDIVTAYQKGYWRVDEIEVRSNFNLANKTYHPDPLLKLTLLLDSNGKKARARKSECDINWCKKIDMNEVNKIITYDLEFFEEKKRNLLALMNGS